MSYEIFQNCEIGTVKKLPVSNGVITFVKSGFCNWLVEYAVSSSGSFPYTRFTTVLTDLDASSLFDDYSK